jgi:hypothetical protein
VAAGRPIPASEPGQRRYVDRAHQERAYRDRHGGQLSLLVTRLIESRKEPT